MSFAFLDVFSCQFAKEILRDLAADEFLLLRKAVDERRCRDEVGVGKLAENAVAYLPDPEY